MATPTTVMFRGEHKTLPSEQDAFVLLVEKFLRIKPDVFTDPTSAHVCKGGRGAAHFAPSSLGMHQPKRLANGWWAELCLSNDQKVSILDDVAQYVDLKRERDWEWRAENRPTKGFIDVDALFAELDKV